MKYLSFRAQLTDWLIHDVFKVHPGYRITGLLKLIYIILHPVEYICYKQQTLNYDLERRVVIIDGLKISKRAFRDLFKVGHVFKVVKLDKNGILTLRDIYEGGEDQYG